MLAFKLIYHPGYDLNLGSHIFPSVKYRLIREQLIDEGTAGVEDFEEPAPASDGQILLAHEAGWVRRLKECKLSYSELLLLEIPWTPRTAQAFWLCAGGSILAARRALRDGVAMNLGGGFHHAFAAHGEGFCAINDIAVAIRVVQKEGAVERAMVVDCDVHQGNGTASIFGNDRSVVTFSIHQLENYPAEKPPSTLDIDLPDFVGDEEYLKLLHTPLEKLLESFRPQLVFFAAGADPYREDQLGGLSLTMEGLRRRDVLVLELARKRHVPVAIVLAGGYARSVADTVAIHANTAKAAAEVFRAGNVLQ